MTTANPWFPILVALGLALGCAPAEPPAHAPQPVNRAPPPKPAGVEIDARAQVFADQEPRFHFADPDRRKKLEAAFGAVDALVEETRAAHGMPSIAYGVVVDGELAHAKGSGYADLETKEAPTPDTIYRIGSITKSFTALVVLSLRDEGRLSLEDPLAKWIPEANKLVYATHDAPPITLGLVLDHRSGLPRLGTFDYTGTVGPTTEQITRSLAGLPLDNPPGSKHVYSNLGFILLSVAAANAGGAPYRTLVQRRIFDPLGMTSTTFDDAAVDPKRLATPYAPKTGGGIERTRRWIMGDAAGAGGIYSTVKDMAKYVAFQLDAYPSRGGPETFPIRRSSRREAHSTATPIGFGVRRRDAKPGEAEVSAFATAYGYGWIVNRTCDLDGVVSHNGAVDGFGASIAFLPEYGVGFVALSNERAAELDALTEKVLATLKRDAKLAPRVRDVDLAPAFGPAMDRLLGVYERWDEAAYKAMLSANRRQKVPVESEKDELAGYKSLHGSCSSWRVTEALSPLSAKVAMSCARGKLEMSVVIDSKDGRITGFSGASSDVPVEREVTANVELALRLTKKWDPAVHKKLFAFAGAHPEKRTEEFYAGLRRDHGECKLVRAESRETEWRHFELACEHGGGLTLNLRVDPLHTADIKGITFAPREPTTCPHR